MTTRAKIVVGVAVLLLGWWAYAQQGTPLDAVLPPAPPEPGPGDPDGTVTASNLVIESGQCVRVDFYASGRRTSTAVAMSACCDDNPNFAACSQSGGPVDSSGVDAFPYSLPPKT